MITGIVALGYNKYGYVSPDIIRQSLTASLVKNSAGNSIIDAKKYLDILGKKRTEPARTQEMVDQITPSNIENTSSDVYKNYYVSDVDFLVNRNIVVKRDTLDMYRLNDLILRQEILGVAMKIRNFITPAGYYCRDMFQDVTYNRPNTWVCPIVEYAADNGIISKENSHFRPEEYITYSEAIAIIMKAANVSIDQYQSSNFTIPAWQVNVIGTAFNHGFIGTTDYNYPNEKATRGAVFTIARKILESRGEQIGV
jgi:hypothetical protein